ncbi:gluconokinase [Vagococcus penaei]|nr:FGGY family carbohydrate kinase [Vagococcus penaei]
MKERWCHMYTLAIDVGTTNLKCHIFEGHQLVDNLSVPIETHYGSLGKIYQNPERILVQCQRLIRSVTQKGYDISAIVFSTAMHSIMPIYDTQTDQELLIWQDYQSTAFVNQFKQEKLAETFYQATGTPIHEMSPFAKIAHFKSKPWFKDVTKWLGIKEYLMEAFTGQCVIDYSVASATGLFNIHKKEWDQDILDYLDITSKELAKPVDTDRWYRIKPSLADELFISQDVKVYVGASDGCLASYASYLANGTANTLTLGTSGAVRKLSRQIELDDNGQTFCYYLTKDYWVIGGATNNGGHVLEWADRVFYGKQQLFKELNHIVTESPLGSRGVLFFPFLCGERAPLWDSTVTASFKGLTNQHEKVDLARSVMEGILFNAYFISELIQLEPRDLSINGGFFNHDILATMAADIFGKTCIQSLYSEPSFGAISLIDPPVTHLFTNQKRIFYNEDNHQRYMGYYDNYKKALHDYY